MEAQIAPLPDVTTSAAPAQSEETAAAHAREERYQQLLRSAPPAANASGKSRNQQTTDEGSPAPPAPSLIDRVVKPIASALGMNRSSAAAQPSNNRPPQTQQPSPGNEQTPKREQENADEDQDVTPPRLVSAEFIPPQLQDGEQTIFAAVVTDDISGVKSVSGVVGSPSGAQIGFACQREAEGGRFVGRINVPKEAAEGRWFVKYLTLTDNAGNTVNLNSSQGTLPQTGFHVSSSASDSKGPVLRAVWLDQQAMAAGEKNQVFVQAEDDKSGVNLVSGVFVSPSKQARIGFGCRLPEGGASWQCPVTPPTCVDCGSWQLEQIQLQDKANNMTTVRADNPLVGNVRLQLFGKSCDSAPPVVESITIDPPVVSNADGGVVRVTAVATDDQCGVASLSGVAMPPSGASSARLYFAFRPVGEGDTFIGEINVPKHAAAGTWTIGWVQALDKGHNLKAYSSNDPVIARATFSVE